MSFMNLKLTDVKLDMLEVIKRAIPQGYSVIKFHKYGSSYIIKFRGNVASVVFIDEGGNMEFQFLDLDASKKLKELMAKMYPKLAQYDVRWQLLVGRRGKWSYFKVDGYASQEEARKDFERVEEKYRQLILISYKTTNWNDEFVIVDQAYSVYRYTGVVVARDQHMEGVTFLLNGFEREEG